MSVQKSTLFAIAPLMLLACSPSNPPPGDAAMSTDAASDASTDTAPAVERMTLTAHWELGPGEERYECFTTHVTRAGGINVTRMVPHAGMAVHHIGVFSDLALQEPDGMRECTEMGQTWGLVYGAGVGTPGLDMPAGTALPLAEGTPVILQMHLLNATGQRVVSDSTVDLEMAPAGATLQPVGTWVLGPLTINLPPNQRTDVNSSCVRHPTLQHVFAAFPHMHQLGVALQVSTGADGGASLVSVPHWNFANQGLLPVTDTAIPADTPIQTQCSYMNTTSNTVTFGLHTGDEMCVVALYYWPAVGAPGLQICNNE